MRKPYFILPFDHRSTFAKAFQDAKQVKEMKRVVFDAFLEARTQAEKRAGNMGILIDLEYCEAIIHQAKKMGIPFALATEKSGQDTFAFEHGDRFGEILMRILPTFAKALVRYDPQKKEDNRLQRSRLKSLVDFCRKHQMKLMLEILAIGEHPRLQLQKIALQEMISDGIEPDIWKLEGLDRTEDWQSLKKLTKADLILLGRGEGRDAVEDWIDIAKKSGEVSGFAIGRTVFMTPLEWLRNEKMGREEAVQAIAKNYLHFVKRWEEI